MTSDSSRLRSSFTAPSEIILGSEVARELRPLLDAVEHALSKEVSTVQCLDSTSQALQRIRQWLIDAPQKQAKDAFRHLHGFKLLLDVLRSLSGRYDPILSSGGHVEFFELLKAVFGVLAEVLDEHHVNRKYFAEGVDGPGWAALERALTNFGVISVEGGQGTVDTRASERLFGCLFAFALKDDTIIDLFGEIRRNLADDPPHDPQTLQSGPGNSKGRSTKDVVNGLNTGPKSDRSQDIIRDMIQRAFGRRVCVRYSEFIPTICRFCLALVKQHGAEKKPFDFLFTSILVALQVTAEASERNLAMIHATGVLSIVFPYLVDGSLPQELTSLLCRLADKLAMLGPSSMEDAIYMYRKAMISSEAADFLLRALRSSRQPAHIHFDMSLHGFSSVELPTLGRSFPPISSSAGFSLTAWIYIDQFDSNLHTTIFGAFDSTQTCFVLAYIEKETHNLIYQTSVTSSRPSIRFNSRTFKPKRWYHISLVHTRPRATSSSKAILFIDGEFVEQLKCHYPSVPTLPKSASTESFASFSSSPKRYSAIQAFLGTPQDLSARLGPDVAVSRWSLASFHLFDDALSHDLIAVYYRLGPRYNGNFQDCLGSFQTYEASAALSLRNEAVYPGKGETSPLVSAIRLKAGNMLPESRILLNISPSLVFDAHLGSDIKESTLVRSLSKRSASNLIHLMQSGGKAIAINGAIPCVNEALAQPHGVAILTGDAFLLSPLSFDDVSWRLGGCAAVGLKMIEVATTRESVVRATECLLESVQENWRNSEAMEKEHAFGILAILLRTKMGLSRLPVKDVAMSDPIEGGITEWQKLSLELLTLILRFVGYRPDRPADSLIINPLAYRILLVDFDIWRKAAFATQKLYYEQFVVFSVESRHHQFNSKRLFRMRKRFMSETYDIEQLLTWLWAGIVRKFLDALKGESLHPDLLPEFVQAFKSLLRFNLSAEVFRSLSLFVTYCLHKTGRLTSRSRSPGDRNSQAGPQVPHSPAPGSSRLSISSPTPLHNDGHDELSGVELAIMILRIYTDLLCAGSDTGNIKKFARTVTNKWLLYLLAEDDPNVVVLGLKMLARLLVVHGSSYVNKFAAKTGGFNIMKHQLDRWWGVPAVWVIQFAILFGSDVSTLDEHNVGLHELSSSYLRQNITKVAHPEVLPVIITMLGTALKAVSQGQDGHNRKTSNGKQNGSASSNMDKRGSTSMTYKATFQQQGDIKITIEPQQAIQAVLEFLINLQMKSQAFRDFAASSHYTQELLQVLYPLIVHSDPVRAEVELQSRQAAVPIFPHDESHPESQHSTLQASTVSSSSNSMGARPRPAQRMSSFIIVSSYQARGTITPLSKLTLPSVAKITNSFATDPNSSIIKSLLDVITRVFVDQIFDKKEFTGFGLFLKAPPGLPEHLVFFESYVLRHTILRVRERVLSNQKVLLEPSVLNSIARTLSHLGEAMLEGWFVNGIEPLLDFAGTILEYLQEPAIARLKSVKLCNQAILTIKVVFSLAVLLKLSALIDSAAGEEDTISFLNRLLYWQTIVFEADRAKPDFIKLMSYLLYAMLVDTREGIRLAAVNFWRILLMHKSVETSGILELAATSKEKHLLLEFQSLKEVDDEVFLRMVDDRRKDFDAFFFDSLAKVWEDYISEENQRTMETAKARISRRKEKLKQWAMDEAVVDDILRRHEVAYHHWMVNIYSSERLKHQRALQDQQDSIAFNLTTFKKLDDDLRRPGGLLEDGSVPKWRLDQTEGRNRIRLRLLPDMTAQDYRYQPKTGPGQNQSTSGRTRADTRARSLPSGSALGTMPAGQQNTAGEHQEADSLTSHDTTQVSRELAGMEDDFEMIDDPRDDGEGFEDKNRMVIRSLQRGDQVEHVYNVSRIIGLEACEGLLIVGKDSLYLLDGFFQRSDGEIVGVSQAPRDERDPYLQMISGRQFKDGSQQLHGLRRESRHWTWNEVVSISKRRFLFRDVAIEVFFTDGRSYLLTSSSPTIRDELYLKLAAKAPHFRGDSPTPNPEDGWRLDVLRSPDDLPQSFGSKIANAFNPSHGHPATQRWVKGEMSNFHYLMLVNTMAGRTFNDLTQYPVFPWVLADYTSQELDLTDPRVFRDLSKPMGAQSLQRQAEFRERYRTFAELGDPNAPPFHYGTHYSSAMIVTSYLIRLQPFVQSYLLLQGGNFDHADRMFFSIDKAWNSASREHMTDVRELIPEFFYLPEFLENLNGYNFGLRQGTGEPIDSVALPPWAKGDPKIFIAKHREALESPFVSKNLHQWIDLIFGFKQRGEAAIEATNVFHHLSYRGAKDLDNIEDSVERLATIGIIHNFGQTPHQVFQRPHPSREIIRNRFNRIDTLAETLTRNPVPLLDSGERVSSLLYSEKHDRLLCTSAFRLYIPPNYDKYVEWGFIDDSVRFFQSDNRKLVGLFEHMHQKQLSSILIIDSKTLITAGTDCTVAVWALILGPKAVDIQSKATLFGHRKPITVLAASRSFGALLSVSTDGQAILWDLNRLHFVRKLTSGKTVECARINDITGDILLCHQHTVSLYTLNGQLLLEQNVCDHQSASNNEGDDEEEQDYITSCAFYEGTGVEWLERDLIFTGHTRGIVKIWSKVIQDGKFCLSMVKRLDCGTSTSQSQGKGSVGPGSITSIFPTHKSVYTGDEDGKVYQGNCRPSHHSSSQQQPQRQRRHGGGVGGSGGGVSSGFMRR